MSNGNRGGEVRAKVIFEQGDSISNIADFIGLDAEEFLLWLDHQSLSENVITDSGTKSVRELRVDEKINCSSELSIPNTIYTFDATAMIWWNQKQRKEMSVLESQGFKVIEIDDPVSLNGPVDEKTKDRNMEIILGKDDVFGFSYWGHGLGGMLLLNDQEGMTSNQISKVKKYKFGYLKLIACEAAQGQWKDIVSINGTFFASYKLLRFYHSWPGTIPLGFKPKTHVIHGAQN